ncbi:MAG: beta-galactosidase [Bacteroidetes bacterium]|nr:beta-galactosidase [Bacteroidota bacterium]MBS1973669.1 beta-galactosidase [Bacteroidota bacterium]
MKKIFFSFVVLLFAAGLSGQKKHIFSFSTNDFLLDGKPFQMISGEMHPARIPKEYWRHRIQMAKAMGCNTIAVYVFWNYQELSPGVFDFASANRNVAEFIRICKEEKMWVLLRPGPYVCAEWDFGGLPSYLLKIPDIKIRCMDSRYMSAVARYISRLSVEIKPLLCTNGGPVLMVQIENEYGSYGNDKTYLERLRKLWLQNGIDVPFYTADGPTPYMLEAGNIDGAAIGLDSGTGDRDFAEAKKRNPNVPSFSSETYPGWLTHWGERWAKPDTNDLKKEITYLLQHKKSFNLYVVHGGTNFGFTAGANAFGPKHFQPDVTSYDYDAPINEQGRPTAKYFMLRNLIARYVDNKIPDTPNPIPTIEIPSFTVSPIAAFWGELPPPIYTPQPQPMESFGQKSGYILYRTKLIGHKSGKLTITEPHDYAMVFLNGKFVDTIYRDGGKWTIDLPISDAAYPQLDILVEAMGHINFAQYMIDRKGITDRVTLNGMTLMNWQTFLLPMDEKFIRSLKPQKTKNDNNGVFFKSTFDLVETGDTYFDMSNFSKGTVWVNGHNLGRYWDIGPQYHLYCPAPWLKKGKNEIVVFDLFKKQNTSVKGVRTLYDF